MIERFYQPEEGEILVDGNPIQSLDLRGFRQIVGYVSQEPVLFNTTIKENLRFAVPDASDEDMIQALKDANAWSFIEKKEK